MHTPKWFVIMAACAAIAFFAFLSVMLPEALDYYKEPETRVTWCSPVTDADIFYTEGGVVSIHVTGQADVVIDLIPSAEAHLVVNSWTNKEASGYAPLAVTEVAAKKHYTVAVPTDVTLHLKDAYVLCLDGNRTHISMAHQIFKWGPAYDLSVTTEISF